jgi:prenyltransferase beta subunit
LVYLDWVKRKQEEVLSWQINLPDDNDDGGFPAENIHDMGGVWTTAETLYTIIKYKILPIQDKRVQRAKDWLLRHRNLGGDYGDGWPLINKGNSFVDTTSMAILALSPFVSDPEVQEAITKAISWLLENQNDDYGWGIWKYEDSLVSATSLTLLALKKTNEISPDEHVEAAIQSGIAWLKTAQNTNGLWGFSQNAKETNNASTCQAVNALIALGEAPKDFKEALKAITAEFKNQVSCCTVQENYTLKYFGEGLDQRLSWFTTPLAVSLLVIFARSLGREVEIKQVIDATESLKRFNADKEGKEVTSITVGHLDIRPWASVQYLRGLLDSQAYLQEHIDEYVSVMSGKLSIVEKAGMLKSLPIIFSPRKQTSTYASGKFLVWAIPIIGLALVGISFLTESVGLEISLIASLFAVYLATFGILVIGFRQKVISRDRFCFLYFPVWALIVLATGLFYFEKAAEGFIVLLLIGFPEILHFVMGKSKGGHGE